VRDASPTLRYKPYLPTSSISDEHTFQVMEQEPDIFTDSDDYKETERYAIVFLFIYCIILPIALFLLLRGRYKSIFDRPGSLPPISCSLLLCSC
jgi:hypothetical protein